VDEPLRHQGEVRAVAFTPDGQTAVTGGGFPGLGEARIWKLSLYPLSQKLPLKNPAYTLALGAGGQTVVTVDRDPRTVRLWKLATGEQVTECTPDSKIVDVAPSPDGLTFVTGSLKGDIQLWDAATGKLRWQKGLDSGSAVNAVAYSPDGRAVLTAYGNEARLWSTATGESLSRFVHGPREGVVITVAFASDGKTILTGTQNSAGGVARLWDVTSGKSLGDPLPHEGAVRNAAFSSSGQTVLTGSQDNKARLWDVSTGKVIGQLVHSSPVVAVAISPDDRTILTGGLDGTAQLWDKATRKPLGPPLIHPKPVWSLAFDADSQAFLTGSGDGTVRRWQVPVPRNDESEYLKLWIQVHTGLELDDNGDVRELDWQTWHERFRRLQEPDGLSKP
jgi:WD40 repeat protein